MSTRRARTPPRAATRGRPHAAEEQVLAATAAARPSSMDSVVTGLPSGPIALGALPIEPAALVALQSEYLAEAGAAWNRCWQAPGERQAGADRRFAAADWATDPSAAFLAELHLLNSRTLMKLAELVEADAKTRARLRFAALQVADASAPSNYLALNPEAQKKALATRGASMAQGLRQLWDDLQRGHLSQTDEAAFEVGRNVATSEGAVVFENALFQLVEYKPLTAKVHARPLLIVPPCINKYYILDLQPENSLIRFCAAEGHRTFVISWKNAGPEIVEATWDHYIEKAVLEAIALVQAIGRSERINTLGFCIGGTLLGTALAVLAGRGERPAASVTLLTTLLDFSDTGILDIFIDEASVRLREMTLGAESPGGAKLLKGQELATTFSFLRPNDLVWNYVVANYLKGETPPPFDLLYWNSDGTNLPGPMYCWYLRNTYLENNLAKPGRLVVCGGKIDLGKVDVPAFVYASREDHIVPWQGAYRSTQLLGGRCRFVLGASGHIAGVINPPLKKKRSHWVGKSAALPTEAETWLASADERPGSWWDDWAQWLRPHAGELVAAPTSFGDRKRKPIEPAPGRYVKEKA